MRVAGCFRGSDKTGDIDSSIIKIETKIQKIYVSVKETNLLFRGNDCGTITDSTIIFRA